MARDPHTTVKVWSGEHGYPGDENYLEFHKQLYPGRLRYWRISQEKHELGKKEPYDPWSAFERLGHHADDFVRTLKETLAQYRGESEKLGTVVSMYDTELFGHWWWEGPEFLYEASRRLHNDPDIECVSGSDLVEKNPPKYTITLPEGSWGEGGYHYIWLNDENIWTWERLYPAQRRMRQMAREYAQGPARAIVEQAARELLLAEASDWQFLISTLSAQDYAEIRFKDHIERFERLSKMAAFVHGGGTLDEADSVFFEECLEKDAAFPVLDLAYWAKLDHPVEIKSLRTAN